MTNPPPEPRPSRSRNLGFDEFVAMLVAFGAVGAILWWGLSRKDTGLNLVQEPQPTATGSLNSPLPTSTPAASDLNSPVVEAGRSPQPSLPTGTASSVPPATAIVGVPPSVPVSPSVTPASPAIPAVVGVAPPPNLVVPSPQASSVQFSDVPADYWARPFIAALAQRGIVAGFANGTFQPDQPVNRAQYAALIETIFQSQTVQNPIAFKDLPGDFWAAPAIDTAVKAGFLKGYPEGTFQPIQPISRVQVFASLVNGLQVSQPTAPADVVKLYRDNDQIPAWAVPVVASATQAGMVVNYPARDALNPNQPATRAEVAAIVYQALAAAGKLEPIPSDYIVRP